MLFFSSWIRAKCVDSNLLVATRGRTDYCAKEVRNLSGEEKTYWMAFLGTCINKLLLIIYLGLRS